MPVFKLRIKVLLFSFRKKQRSILLIAILSLLISCSTISSHQEHLSDYYWEVQSLRWQAGEAKLSAGAWRDLGIIYLRTGEYEKADYVLSRAMDQDRTDSKLWFYAGLTQELLNRKEEALSRYMQAPTLSLHSLYNRAMKGRISRLQDELRFPLLQRSEASASETDNSISTFAVRSFFCQGATSDYARLGIGLSELISRNLDQLNDINVVTAQQLRILERATRTDENIEELAISTYGIQRFVSGTCEITNTNRIRVDLVLRDLNDLQTINISAEQDLERMAVLENTLMNSLTDELQIWIPNRERRLPVTSVGLEALMAFSEGLDFEFEGEMTRSLDSYNQALLLHPSFALAEAKIEGVQNRILARGSGEAELIDLLVRLESYLAAPDLVSARLVNAGNSINSALIPNQDARKLPPGKIGELATPPLPVGN